MWASSPGRCPMCIYIYTHIYICCRVKTWSKIWFFESKLGPRLGQDLVQDLFCLFPQVCSVWGLSYKSQIVCRGAKIIVLQFVRVSKRVFENKCALFVFLCWIKKEKQNRLKNGEKLKNCVLGEVVNKQVFWGQNWHVLKNRQTLFVFRR